MTPRTIISTYISRLIVSIALLVSLPTASQAQLKMFRIEKDSIPLFRGFSVSFDLVSPAMLILTRRIRGCVATEPARPVVSRRRSGYR